MEARTEAALGAKQVLWAVITDMFAVDVDMSDATKQVIAKASAFVINSPISERVQVAILLVSFGGRSCSTYGHVVSSLQTVTGSLAWETVTASLLQEYDEKSLGNS